ncbi:tetratricopeptide repeat protein [Blastopirellula sp. JC732]|uniref:Tetratricopeptide repeat protein n=1 Tax=Blastopirellula sediminis TaxID=2894196 RepID=A0A9X1MJR7_9BACT|nr:tetratricopeptide repeat protein [Blastopirellula sediminis]MCC9608005.1 tetratricopeptide repeat protein [Blastopirellula sediminis]MCC9627202.1 tetratricopeptide repeat protein [Blastopirellula sediminis]
MERLGSRQKRIVAFVGRSFCWAITLAGLFLVCSPCAAETLSEAKELFRTGQYEKCADAAAKEIADGTYSEEWRLLRLESELMLGRYADALTSLEEARKVNTYSIRLRWLERDIRRYNGDSAKAKEVLAEIAAEVERLSARYRSPEDMVVVGSFFLEIGDDPKQIRTNRFKQIQQRAPGFSGGFIVAAELALAKNDYALAAEDFQKAIKVDPENPRILYGLARAFESSDAEKAEGFLAQSLEINPNYIPSLLFIAEEHLQAERYDEAEKQLEKVFAINPAEPKAWAIRAVIAHLSSDAEKEKKAREEALKHWTDNPEVDYLIGKYLAQKYRFAEAAAAQRQALAFDSSYLPAKMELSNDLLRLGEEEAGWKLAEEVFDADNYNVVAHNLSTLHDHMAKYRTLIQDGFVVRMDAKEAEIYGPRVLELLVEAKQVLCEKYNVELPETVAVEIFPRQQDFAIRTFGLPGGAGFLGVCFGSVVTMNSPASQGSTPSNWEAVLWHEFCHVVTLTKTHNKMPRWLSEGISVYEERLRDPAWGQSLSLRYRTMILGDDLTPVSQLSGAFLRPKSPQHLMFAYYESSLVVEFLVDKFGIDALRAILDDLGKGLQINDAITRHAAPVEAFDAEFEKYIREQANAFAEGADFTEEEIPASGDAAVWKEWLAKHPDSFQGLGRYAMALIAEEKWEEAREPIERLVKLAPDYAGEGSGLPMKAKISRELGETEQEVAVLEHLAELSADGLPVYRRLADLHAEQENWEAVTVNARRILAVNPLLPEPHRLLATAGEKSGDRDAAIDGLRAISLMDPFDPADVHYRAAKLLHEAGRSDEARKQVLLALEEAPRYRDAHQLLLQLVEAKEADSDEEPAPMKEDPMTEEAAQ